jgi:hypothetical protein
MPQPAPVTDESPFDFGSALHAPVRSERSCECRDGQISADPANIIEISQINLKSDMSRWTRAHAASTGINWSVFPGPGGTMIVVEHEEDREAFLAALSARIADEAA